jgi:Peptidase family M28
VGHGIFLESTMTRFLIAACTLSLLGAAEPNPAARRWWAHVQVLAADDMQGRETGSEGYKKAARYVVEQFTKAGLKPAGSDGYFQPVPLQAVELRKDQSSVEVLGNGSPKALRLFQEVIITPRIGLPASVEAPMVFAGYGLRPEDLGGRDAKGKILVYFNALPARYPTPERTAATAARRKFLSQSGAVGAVAIDNPLALETPRWPVAYAKAVSIAGVTTSAPVPDRTVSVRLNADSADEILRGSGHTFAELLKLGAAGEPLPSFDLKTKLRMKIKLEESGFRSDNILGLLPGSDPTLQQECVVVSAHLDGYGIGEPVDGDRIYNGAFDDSAYVATLIEFAARLHETGKAPRRSLLFAVFTGEEKGLLGSAYFTTHPTVPKERMVANINLDYLRPIFPLRILTALALTDTSLGATAKEVGGSMGIHIQADNEPERGLFRRADQYNFLRIGVPAIAFIFGYEPGSSEERIYRKWYSGRYHAPSDDLKQPVNYEAAAKFNQFFEALTEKVANSNQKPVFDPKSQYGK